MAKRYDDVDRTVPPEENYYSSSSTPQSSKKAQNSGIVDHQIEHQRGIYSSGNSADYDLSMFSAEEGTNRTVRDRTVPTDEMDEPAERGINPTSSYDTDRSSRGTKSSGSGGNGKKKGKGKNKKKKKVNKPLAIIIAIIAVILALAIAVVALAAPVLDSINYDDKTDNEYVSSSDLTSSDDVINILVLGVDARSDEDDESSRSDSMMLVSLDKANGCIKLVSFLRDTWVYIPCYGGSQRLNAACTYGGYSGVVDTIEYNFGIDIDGYVVADFEMFEIMVDAIGGVEIDVTEAEAEEINNHQSRYGNVTIESGTHVLTGEQALAYCRIRKIDSDWARTERQRTVMVEILSGILSSGPVTAYNMLEAVAPYIETDLSKQEIIEAGLSALTCISGGFFQTQVPFDDTWSYETISGASVISCDADENKELLINYIYNTTAEDLEAEEEEEE